MKGINGTYVLSRGQLSKAQLTGYEPFKKRTKYAHLLKKLFFFVGNILMYRRPERQEKRILVI